jgi:hypothetical protein
MLSYKLIYSKHRVLNHSIQSHQVHHIRSFLIAVYDTRMSVLVLFSRRVVSVFTTLQSTVFHIKTQGSNHQFLKVEKSGKSCNKREQSISRVLISHTNFSRVRVCPRLPLSLLRAWFHPGPVVITLHVQCSLTPWKWFYLVLARYVVSMIGFTANIIGVWSNW